MDKKNTYTGLKKDLVNVLSGNDFKKIMMFLENLPVKKTINTLISFLCHLDEQVRWHSVTALGELISTLAVKNSEEGRIVMRRFMWMLNEESGGIGWGVPEAMGEVLTKSSVLDREFNRILLSYIDDHGNYLEHDPLRQGALWGVARVSEFKPHLMENGAAIARGYLESENQVERGLACLIAGYLCDRNALANLESLVMDKTAITLYKGGDFSNFTVGCLAEIALEKLS